MSQDITDFETWLDQMVEQYPMVRIGLSNDGKLVPRQTLRAALDENTERTLSLDSVSESQIRYRYEINAESSSLIPYYRYTITVDDGEFEIKKSEIVVEIDTNKNPDDITISENPEIDVDQIHLEWLDHAYHPDFERIEAVYSRRVAGLENERDRLSDFLTVSLTDWGLREETGILLKGPPGTGKTELVKSVCEKHYGGIPTTIQGPEVLSKWVGESEATLRRKFKEAQESTIPVIYIDEVDAIGAARSQSTQDYTAQIVSQLLVLLDGIETKTTTHSTNSEPMKVIASTNAPAALDPALTRPGRLGDDVLEFRRPEKLQRRAIIHHYLESIYAHEGKLGSELREAVRWPAKIPDELIDRTQMYTGADIERVIIVAARKAKQSDGILTYAYLRQALDETAEELPTGAANKSE